MVRVLAASSARVGVCALALLAVLGAGFAVGAQTSGHRVLAASTCPVSKDWNSIVTEQLPGCHLS